MAQKKSEQNKKKEIRTPIIIIGLEVRSHFPNKHNFSK